MKILSNLVLDFGKETDIYFNLFLEEDFDFKTKDININFEKLNDTIEVKFEVRKVLDLKIASNALIKSLEIINKSLEI